MVRNNFCGNNFMNKYMPWGCGCSAYPYLAGVSPYGGVRPAGLQGPRGAQGPQGPAGATGAQGPAGATGPQGPRGLMGPQGVQGAAGTQGLRGPKGDTGATGLQGPAGMAATIRVEATERIPFDDNPSVVNVGTPHEAVLRFAIPSGMPGATGEQGPKGDPGETGPAGAAGLQGHTGSTGPTGPKGATGPTGVSSFGQLNSIIASADLKKGIQTQVPLHYGGESNNVTLAIGTITVKESGYYTLFYSMRPYLILTADYADLTFSLRANGVDIPQTPNTVRAVRGTHELSFYGSTIVWLRAGAVVDSAFTCNEDAKFFFSIDNTSSLFLYKIA